MIFLVFGIHESFFMFRKGKHQVRVMLCLSFFFMQLHIKCVYDTTRVITRISLIIVIS